jgi:hypothetical protein
VWHHAHLVLLRRPLRGGSLRRRALFRSHRRAALTRRRLIRAFEADDAVRAGLTTDPCDVLVVSILGVVHRHRLLLGHALGCGPLAQ